MTEVLPLFECEQCLKSQCVLRRHLLTAHTSLVEIMFMLIQIMVRTVL